MGDSVIGDPFPVGKKMMLNKPEALYGRDACQCERTPEESYQRIFDHLRQLLPEATERQIRKLI